MLIAILREDFIEVLDFFLLIDLLMGDFLGNVDFLPSVKLQTFLLAFQSWLP